MARLASANPTPDNAPVGKTLAASQTVTVTDPRHPLYGLTLPLVGVANKPHKGRCCIVWIRPGLERIVPVTSTDLNPSDRPSYSIPLSITALEALLIVFKNIQHNQPEALIHAVASTAPRQATDCSSSSLATSELKATKTSSPDVDHSASPSPDVTAPVVQPGESIK